MKSVESCSGVQNGRNVWSWDNLQSVIVHLEAQESILQGSLGQSLLAP
jgi:hypothetical protein